MASLQNIVEAKAAGRDVFFEMANAGLSWAEAAAEAKSVEAATLRYLEVKDHELQELRELLAAVNERNAIMERIAAQVGR